MPSIESASRIVERILVFTRKVQPAQNAPNFVIKGLVGIELIYKGRIDAANVSLTPRPHMDCRAQALLLSRKPKRLRGPPLRLHTFCCVAVVELSTSPAFAVVHIWWFGKVKDGKEGSMYLGDTPDSMKDARVGEMLRWRKSARNPSSEMRMVVGLKVWVPLLRVSGVYWVCWTSSSCWEIPSPCEATCASCDEPFAFVARYAP
ncbi:hypothetical protein KC329_g116 [Hortaea werneckii]|nr:hypothetical protein KC329_g116 [Hortaea werneckii]